MICVGSAALLIPSMVVRAVVIMGWGILIFTYERYLGLPVPASPGTMLWLGSMLSYVIGGLGTDLLYRYYGMNFIIGFRLDLGLRYLDSALLYLGLGLGSYAFGLWLTGQILGPVSRQREVVSDLKFGNVSILLLGFLFILPQVIKDFISSSAYNNLVIGALQSIEIIPMILFAFYLVRPHPRWWVGLLLLAAAMANSLSGILIGYGRAKFLIALVTVASVWLGLVLYMGKRISWKARLLIALLPLLIVLFFGFMTAYRQLQNYNRNTSLAERLQIAQESSLQFAQSRNIFIQSIGPLINRLVELSSLELLGWVENGNVKLVGWTLEDTKQVLLAWVPKVFFPEKGMGYGRDIMVYYGLSPSNDNRPVTLLADAFRRFGLAGVLGIYFFMGIASTIVAHRLMPHWGEMGLILVLYFGLLHLTIYSSEVLEVFKLYFYRLPSSALVIIIFLRISGIWRPRRNQNEKHFMSS